APADPTTPVATIADLGQLAASVDLSEFDVAKVRPGDAAIVAVDALGGRKLPGRVSFVAPVGIDSGGVVSFPVRVRLVGPVAAKPGMNVSVRVVVAARHDVVRVPLEALHGTRVTVLDRSGRPSPRRVSLGLADSKQVEIRSGLRSGERVVLPSSGA